METPKLKPAKDLEPFASYDAYFDSRPKAARDCGYDLSDIFSIVFHRSIEAAWPSMLRVGRVLKEGSLLDARGWNFRMADTGNPWQVAFVAEQVGEAGGGFLYTCHLEKQASEAAKAKSAAEMAEISNNPDPEERRRLIAAKVIARLRLEEPALPVDDSEFADPATVSLVNNVTVHAWRRPEGIGPNDGSSSTLPELLSDVSQGKYADGLVATCRPTDDRWQDEPSQSTSDRCDEGVCSLKALEALDVAIRAAGLYGDLTARGKAVSSWSYMHFGSEQGARLAEAAQSAVYADSGFAAQHSFETCWSFWSDAAAWDLTRLHGQIGEAALMLKANGHVDAGSRFSCNDMDDHAFVTEDRGLVALWLDTQNGSYGILFRQSPDRKSQYHLSRVDKDCLGMVTAVSGDTPGFLGSFDSVQPDEEGMARFAPTMMGRFTDRAVRGINNILLTLDSVHCCLEDEYGQDALAPS